MGQLNRMLQPLRFKKPDRIDRELLRNANLNYKHTIPQQLAVVQAYNSKLEQM